MRTISRIFKKIVSYLFIVQTDPWTKEVSKKRLAIFVILVVGFFLGLILVTTFKPLEQFSKSENDKKRIADLEKLKTVLINYYQDTGQLPKVGEGQKFLVGGKDSPNSPNNNWLGVNLSEYLDQVPTDPKYVLGNTAPYPYRYTTDGFAFKLDTYLETNPDNLMQQDGGVANEPGIAVNNRARYEVGTNLFLRF